MGEMQLLPQLQTLKQYFLLEQGDFFVSFMDLAKEEWVELRRVYSFLFSILW